MEANGTNGKITNDTTGKTPNVPNVRLTLIAVWPYVACRTTCVVSQRVDAGSTVRTKWWFQSRTLVNVCGMEKWSCLFEIRKIALFPLAFIAGWLQGHWWGFISRNYVVWPTFLLMNVVIALKGSHFWFLFSEQFRKLIIRYKRIGYNPYVMRQTACLVINLGW